MKLKELCNGQSVRILKGGEEEINLVTLDSRMVSPGALFAAVVDPLRNGEAFLPDALDRGASAILARRETETGEAALVLSEDVPNALALMAHKLQGDPTRDMTVIGVTGTNGKTSFSYIMESILLAADRKVAVVGTVNHRFDGKIFSASNTTPEAPQLAALLADMKTAGARDIVMEASSHGLALSRVAGCRFRIAVFTNLSRDHMDFHNTPEEYLGAKTRLFSEFLDEGHPEGAFSVVNVDDEKSAPVIAASKARVITYGRSEKADYRMGSCTNAGTGLQMEMTTPQGAITFQSRLLGGFQAYNIASAAATALEMGIDPETVSEGIASLAGVPGRMEIVPDDDVLVLVDYAHTPAALLNVVSETRKITPKRLITIFGCGGDRDHGKRPFMAEAAASESDIVVVTSDNPRTEDPGKIIDQILRGFAREAMETLTAGAMSEYAGGAGLFVEEDRPKAIAEAIGSAKKGDTVLIAGKGHENYQVRGLKRYHMDDRELAAEALAQRRRKIRNTAEVVQ